MTKQLKRQASIQKAFDHSRDLQGKYRRAESGLVDQAQLQYLYVRWITICNISFNIVSVDEFRNLVYFLSTPADQLLCETGDSVRK